MKLRSCLHLEELKSTLRSTLSLDLLFMVYLLLSSFALRSFSQKNIRARAMKLGSCIYLEELKSTLHSVLSLDLYFMVH